MADSIQKQVLDYVVTALTAPGAPAPAFRTRTESFSADQMPAFNVYPLRGSREVAEDTVETLGQRFSFAVVPLGTAPSSVDVVLDPLFVWVCQRLLADTTLGGLVLDTTLDAWDWTFPAADSDISSCSMTFSALLAVKRADPTASGLNS